MTHKVNTSHVFVASSDEFRIVKMERRMDRIEENNLQQCEQLVKLAYEERQQMKMMSIPTRKAYKMAASVPVVRQIHRKLLCCPLCQQRYDKPKLLPCFHSFCQNCLVEYLPKNSITVSCPVCRHSSILPQDGVAAIQDNHIILDLMEAIDFENVCASCQRTRALAKCTDCDVFVCDGCVAAHILESSSPSSLSQMPHHHIIKICSSATGSLPDLKRSAILSSVSCVNHERRAFEYFCTDCETAICGMCRSLEHVEHPTKSLLEATMLHKNDLKDLLRQAYLTIECMRSLVDQVGIASDDLLTNYRDTQTRVCGAFDALMEALREQKDALLTQLKTAFDDKRKLLNDRTETLEDRLIAAENFCRFTENVLTHGDETELLLVRKEMTNRLSHLNAKDIEESLGDSSFLGFDDEDFSVARKYLTSLGGIKSIALDLPVELGIRQLDIPNCRTNQLCTVSLISNDFNCNKIKLAPSFFFVKLSSNDCDVKSQPVVCRNSDGDIILQYTVTKPGCYSIDIKLFNKSIKGSPFTFSAYDESTDMEESFDDSKSSLLDSSMSIAGPTEKDSKSSQILSYNDRVPARMKASNNISSESMVVRKPLRASNKENAQEPVATPSKIPTRTVIERLRGVKRPPSSPPAPRHVTPNKTNQNRRIDRVKAAVVKIGSEGRDQGEFVNPQGVCFSGEKILITDSNNSCVQVFSALTGQFLRRLGKKGCLQGQLSRPMGVAVAPSGNYLVTDFETRYISVYNPHGKYLRKFGTTTQMVGPKGMCVDSDGRVVVVDNKGCSIYVYQADGKLLNKFGTRGYEPGQLSGPQYCAVTASNDIIVSDFHQHNVKVFSRDGSQMKFSFGSQGDKEGQFNGPTGVAVHSTGHIVVADWGNSRIQIFNEDGTFNSLVDTTEDPLYGPQGLSLTPAGHVIVADSGHHCFKIFRITPLSKS